ncbi:MAG: hypothetical protein GX167_04925 [Firmicutes bacterium]|nr:hypothetical protein [Bacillota bacterium]
MMKRLLRNNTFVRLTAFFLAFIFWAYVTGDYRETETQNITRRYPNVPLEWVNLQSELELTKIPEEIEVILEGRSSVLDNITLQTLNVFVDLRNLGAGQHRLTPVADLPGGVRVVSFNPEQVVVVLEEIQSPQMLVEVDLLGSPAPHYQIGEVNINPQKAFVRGARSRLEKVARVRAIVNVDGADSSLTQYVGVQAVDFSGQVVEGVSVHPSQVEITVPVALPQKTVPVRLQVSGELQEGLTVQQVILNPAEVTLEGPQGVLDEISEVLTEPVDITEAESSLSTAVALQVPQGCEALHVGPIHVEIKIAAE